MRGITYLFARRITFLYVTILGLALIFSSTATAAGTPTILSFQGRLADSSGNLLGGNGTNYYFKFSIWNDPTVGSGSKLWPTSLPSSTISSVRQGVFNVNIGDTAAGYPDVLDYNFSSASDIYLQIEVSSDNVTFQTLGPRQRITAAAFARLSGAVSGADTPSSFGTTTPIGGAQISVEATSTNSILMTLRARASQVANLFQIQNAGGTNIFSINANGGIFGASTLDITGTTTLATTTATQLTVSGGTVLGVATTSSLTVNGTTNVIGDILPSTTGTRSLGTNALRFLNLFSQNVFASSSVITNATSTNSFATNLAGGTLNVTGQTTLANASTSALTVNGTAFHIGDILPTTDIARSLGTNALRFLNLFSQNIFASSSIITNATSTNSFATNLFGTNATLSNASTTNLTTSSLFNVLGTSTLATTTATQLTVSGGTVLGAATTTNLNVNGTLSILGDIIPTTNISRSLGSNASRILNLFTQNIFASSSVITNASSTALTLGVGSSSAGRLYFANASNGFTTQLISSSTQASNLTFTLPGTSGASGDVLKSDGTGGMFWDVSGGGGLSGGTNGFLARWTSGSTLATGLFLDDGIVAGINATSSSYTFNVQGSAGLNPFNVASSTGASLFSIDTRGKVTLSGDALVLGTSIFATTSVTDLTVSGDIIQKGVSWTAASSTQANSWFSVAYGNGLYVAISQDGTNRIMTSPDGTTWTARNAAAASQWYSVTYGNGLFVAVAAAGATQVMTSPDGIVWTPRSASSVASWKAVTYGNALFGGKQFVAIAYGSNKVMTSPDGITWTAQTAATSDNWTEITYGNELYVAIADSVNSTNIMTSPDGVTWTSRTPAASVVLGEVVYGNGLYVIVGSGTIMTSPNGITWTSRTGGAGNTWTALAYGNGTFVALSTTGNVLSSTDGITWTSRTSPVTTNWQGATYGNGRFVAVGISGTNRVLYSGKPENSIQSSNNIYQGGMSILNGALNIGTTTTVFSPFYNLNMINVASTSGASYLTLTNGGNLGLGTTTPNSKLTIIGDSYFAGNVFSTGTLSVLGLATLGNASSTALTLGIASSTAGRLFFSNASNGFTTQLISSSTQASNLTFTLPGTTGGVGQVLTTDGSGGLYFASSSSGGVTGGTNGFLARWTSPSTLSTSLFMDDGIVSGINATSSLYTFNLQGSAGLNPFNVSSSTGASLFSIDTTGKVTMGNASTTNLTASSLFNVLGTSTLATTTISSLTVSGGTVLGVASTSDLTVNGTAFHIGDILPTTDIARSLGSATNRFLNLFTQNIFASSSVITNATSTNLFGDSITASTTLTSFATTTLATIGGNVGIGTTSPFYKLDVNGVTRSSSILTPSLVLSGAGASAYGTLSTYNGFNGYINTLGGLGTGGNDSVLNTQRITSTGNLVNIGSIQAGQTSITRAGVFSLSANYTTGSNPQSGKLADVNGDGKLDFIVAGGSATSKISVFINNGNGTYAAKQDYSVGINPRRLVLSDFNGDGKVDVATGDFSTNAVYVLRNNGDGTYASAQSYPTSAISFGIATGDLNGDGNPDLISTNQASSSVSVLMNNGNGTFASRVDYVTGSSPSPITVADFNGDGKLDIVSGNTGTTTVSVLMNNGNGTLATKVDYVTGNTISSIAAGDVNGDGKADIITTYESTSFIAVLMNNGNGTFATRVEYATLSAPDGIAIGDLNGDGVNDLAATDQVNTKLVVFINNGGGTFASRVEYTTPGSPRSVSLGDVNNDGKMDAVTVNAGGPNISIFFNSPTTLFSALASTGTVGVGTSTATSTFTVQGIAGSNNPFTIASSSGATLFSILANGTGLFTNASTTGLTLGIASSTAGRLYFSNASNGFTTQLISSSTQASNLIFTLPGTSGSSGDVLKSDGSGGMFWGTAAGGITGGTNGFLARWTSPSTLSTGLFLDSGTFAGVNATSSSYTFNVQGSSGVNPFNVASSTGASLFSIDTTGKVTMANASTTNLTASSLFNVLGTSTLATTAISSLTVSGGTVLGVATTTGLTVNGALSILGDILPISDSTPSLGTNALRFLNLFIQNIFASSSVITNATSTNLFGTNATLGNASTSVLTAPSLFFTNATGTTQVSAPLYTGSGAVTLSSGGSAGLTLESASGRVTVATGDFLNTGISGVSGAGAGDIWYDTSDNKYKINENGTTKIICNTIDAGCGSGGGGVSLAPGAAQSDTSTSSSIFINKTQTLGNFLQFQQAGLDKFIIGNTGGISVFADTGDITKTTTGTTRTQDFSVSGSTFQNTTSSNDVISIDDGAITLEGSIAASAATTQAAIGRGAQVIYRDDGKYIIIHGNSTTGGSIWDGTTTGAMSVAPTNPTITTTAGLGAVAIKRPDGRYLVVHGNATTGDTSLYDPYGLVATAAGPDVCAAAAITIGTNAILRDDGKYLILCGGFSSTSLYDPTLNTVTVGPALPSGTFGAGAHALARPDGTFLIFKGGNTTGTAIYNPYNATTGIGSMADVTLTNAPTIATSSLSLRLQDGTFMVIPGAANSSTIYDPKGTTASSAGVFTTLSGAGNGPSTTLQEGAQIFWRQDGNYLLLIGSGSTVTNVLKPGAASGSKFVTTNAPSLSAAAGVGLVGFMTPDGRYAILRGGGTGMDYYDMGFVIGGKNTGTGPLVAYYETECMDSGTLNDKTIVTWNANAEGSTRVEYRTVTSPSACSTGTYATTTPGDTIKNFTSGNNRIQLRVTLKRTLPKFIDQEWGVVRQNITRYRRVNSDPALYDISINNGIALHRTQFDFGDSTATSGPVTVNITNDKNNSLAISLEAGVGYGSTASTVANGGGIYTGAFGANPSLTTTATSGTIIMKRPDDRYVVISGNTTANAQLYDPETQTFTALGAAPAAGTGFGALAFKRPDGKYFIVLGNNTTTTSIFDPVLNTFTAGPALSAAAGVGSQIISLPTGKVLIIHGNLLQTTSVYDPIQNVMMAGPTPTTAVGQGSVLIPRPDGKYFFIPGMITAGCTALNTVANIFDPYTMVFTNVNTPGLTGTGPGAFAFQRKDGLWVIVRGGSTVTTCAGTNATHIYNPYNNKIVAGPTLSAVAGYGASLMYRPDNIPLLVLGSSTTATSFYREELGAYTADIGGPIGAFIAGPTLQAAAGPGSVTLQRQDGKYVLINGGAVSTVQMYDGGWVKNGIYKTEYFNLGSKLTSASTLSWTANTFTGISVEVKTAASEAAMQNAAFREVAKSGALINPAVGDTYMQVNFNFSRSFPSYPGILTDVWFNGGGQIYAPFRKIDTPTLYDYKVNNEADLLDLQTDGLSVLRVNSSGDLFTQTGATINTSGADLAERYTSSEQLEKGEVVSIDPQNNHGVKRGMYQYQPDVLGVVSTDPGFVAGAYTDDSYPIALVGRVPIKISTENGMIRSGDFLTMSSVPGHAMKATLSGRVIGKALDTVDESKLTECPDSMFTITDRKCGTVMMFVNLIDYNGEGIEVALANWKANKEQLTTDTALVGLDISESAMDAPGLDNSQLFKFSSSHSEEILNFLTALKKERAQGVSSQSEIFTDRISAASEIISPKMVTSLLEASKGVFGSIEGLSLSVNSITSKTITTEKIESGYGGLVFEFTPNGSFVLRKQPGRVAGAATSSVEFESTATSTSYSTDIFASASSTASSTDIVVTFDSMGNASFAGNLSVDKISAGGLDVSGNVVFKGGLEVSVLGTASSTLNILSDTYFFGRPYFTSDMGGTATIKKGAKSVQIEFEREHIENPIVSASIVYTSTTTSTMLEKLFTGDIRFVVTNRTTKGFTININKNAEDDIAFNWIALAVKSSKDFTSKEIEADETVQAAPVSTPLPVGTTTESTISESVVQPPAEDVTQANEQATTTEQSVVSPSATGMISVPDEQPHPPIDLASSSPPVQTSEVSVQTDQPAPSF